MPDEKQPEKEESVLADLESLCLSKRTSRGVLRQRERPSERLPCDSPLRLPKCFEFPLLFLSYEGAFLSRLGANPRGPALVLSIRRLRIEWIEWIFVRDFELGDGN